MSLSNLFNTSKVKSSRKFISPRGTACIFWSVDKEGTALLTIQDAHKAVHFSEWCTSTKDIVDFDKQLAVIVDEINAMRKILKTPKK
jgi:hypothetical protein